MDATQRKNLRLVRRLLIGCLLMFGFGFALVPLYDVFCKVTGLNGKVLNVGPVSVGGPDLARTIKVQLIAVNNEGMPWLFKAQAPQLEVHPGETRKTAYLAHNPTASRMVAQAIPSVAPAEAAQYLHKVNCFCFDQQPLDGFETREMPLLFVVDPEIPRHIKTITLSYTLFDITPKPEQHTELIGDRSTTRRIWL